MKRILLSILSLLLFSTLASAQSKSLQFIYIAKDYTTMSNELCNELRDIYNFARKEPNSAVVFYLPNATSPIVVKVNLPGDNRNQMDRLFDALMTKSETIINPFVDNAMILKTFEDTNFISKDGTHTFSSVEFTYYVTPTFWALQHNEQIIAALYFAMDFDSEWAQNYVTMSIYHCEDDGLEIDEQAPFGNKDLCYNYTFHLLTY